MTLQQGDRIHLAARPAISQKPLQPFRQDEPVYQVISVD